MRRMLLTLLCVLSVGGMCRADEGHGDKDEGGAAGPQGPAGAQGPQGAAGKNGTNGSDATSGWSGTNLAADVALRLADSKYLQLQAYDTYVFGSHPGQDVFGQGFNQTIGARIVIKLGSSYEEDLIKKQASEIKALEMAVSRLQQ